jgi:sec-independent protein translocase protein TatA
MVGLDNPLHIGLVLVVVLLVFGAKRLPELGKSMGEGLRGFKHALGGDMPEHHLAATPDSPAAAASAAAMPATAVEQEPPAAH